MLDKMANFGHPGILIVFHQFHQFYQFIAEFRQTFDIKKLEKSSPGQLQTN
jgi:hypothetical protein